MAPLKFDSNQQVTHWWIEPLETDLWDLNGPSLKSLPSRSSLPQSATPISTTESHTGAFETDLAGASTSVMRGQSFAHGTRRSQPNPPSERIPPCSRRSLPLPFDWPRPPPSLSEASNSAAPSTFMTAAARSLSTRHTTETCRFSSTTSTPIAATASK